MSRFWQMKFSRKIFLAIFGTASMAILITCLVLYSVLSEYRTEDFADSYIDHMNLMAKALNRMEESQARIAFNTVQVVQLKDREARGRLTGVQLKALAEDLGVSQINIYDVNGSVIAHSGAKPVPLYTTFPNLRGKTNSVYQTHLLKGPDSIVRHHTIISSDDGKRIIEAAIYFDHVTQLLREMIEHDDDNLSVEMISDGNQSLGRISREGFTPVLDLEEILKWKDGVHWYRDYMFVLTSVNDEQNNYRLVATISTQTLDQYLRRIHYTLFAVTVVLIAFSWFLSSFLRKNLLKKIDGIREILNYITGSQDYSQRLPSLETSQDEIDELGKNLNRMLETLQAHQTRLLEAERDKARAQVAAQVAHDIRSPLMSMNMALGQIESAQSEPLAILKSAVSRVAGIVQKLSALSAKPEEAFSSGVETPKLTLIEPMIASVVNEHHVRKQSHQTLNFYGVERGPHIWSVVQVTEIQTALSNMINNAFEAGANEVSLNLSEQAKSWTLEVKDNGSGIPSSIIDKIFERSFTFGKKTGTGLGLFQAKAAIEWSGGTLNVQTAEGQGTTFTIKMPKEKTPIWMPGTIEVDLDQTIYFVDDDEKIVEQWREKAITLGLKNAVFYTSVEDFENEAPLSAWPETALLVIDQNLSENRKGLEILAALGLGKRGYLCTSDFDEKWIQDQVKKIGGFLIPKLLVSQFEIKVRAS